LKPLSILFFFVSGSRSLYGTETRFVEMLDAFQKNNAEVLSIESYPSFNRISARVNYPCREVAVIFNRKRRLSASLTNLIRVLSNGIRACLSSKFDLVVSAERNFMNVLPAFMVSRMIRKPLVIVIHHAVRDDYIHRKELPLQVRTKGLVNGIFLSWGREIHHLICRRAELVVAVSEATKREFCDAYGIRPERVVVTGNGSRVRVNPTAETGVRAVDAAYLGRFADSKGVFLLPAIWKTVIQKRPGSRLVIAGGKGPELSEMHDLVKEMGLQENVDVLGYLTDYDASALLATSRVFVLPSTKEGFSIVTAEAMSSGCVCVVSDLPALRGVFRDAATYVPVGDVSKFAEVIFSTLENEARRKELSNRSVEFASRFSWDSIAKEELALYATLTARYAR
jgi:glycosyltransferase involved in cell wall biosynthesis